MDQRLRGVVRGVETRRCPRDGRLERAGRLLVAPAREQHVPAGEPRLRPVGTPLRRGGEGAERLAVAMLLGQHHAEVVVKLRALGRDLERLPIRGDRAVAVARRNALLRFAQQGFELASHRRRSPHAIAGDGAAWRRQPQANQANAAA